MDAHILDFSKVMLYLLYASIALLYRWTCRDIQPGLRGFDWFVGSYLALASAVVVLLLEGRFHHHVLHPLSSLLLLLGHLLLHLAFGELFGDREAWLQSQCVLGIIGVAVLVWPLLEPSQPAVGSLVGLVWCGQYGIIGWMIMHRGYRGSRIASNSVGGVVLAYAAIHIFWFVQGLRHGIASSSTMGIVSELIRLLTHTVIAFGFLLLAGSLLKLRLQREAEIDELTGLMNLRAVRRTAAREIALCQRKREQMGVLMIDLDNMKAVNDRLGHGAGDALLPAVAGALTEVLRDGDNLGRVGGDEFCLLLPNATEEEALRIAQRCRTRLIDLQVAYRGEHILVSASFGVAHTAVVGWQWEELLRRSDGALYQAKREGRNRVVVTERDKKTSVLWQMERMNPRRRFESVRSRL